MIRPRKILVIRFSSMGDVVLTTPALRSLKNGLPEAEIHFLTKKAFVPLLEGNPCLSKVHGFEGKLKEWLPRLRSEQYDYVLDWHDSLRSRILRLRLGVPTGVYPKDRWQNAFYIRFRMGRLASRHTVERYGATLAPLGCEFTPSPLEFYLTDSARAEAQSFLGSFGSEGKPVAAILGATAQTKKWPLGHWAELLNRLARPVVLLGGVAEIPEAEALATQLTVPVLDATGKMGIQPSAALLTHCQWVISHDTGFMHIATALGCQLFTLWGNTVPELGFSPWGEAKILQVEGLACRPCSKLGASKCPKGHFYCMVNLRPDQVLEAILNP